VLNKTIFPLSKRDAMAPSNCSRREFIAKAGKGVLAGALMVQLMGTQTTASSKSVKIPMEPVRLDLSKPDWEALTKPGGSMKVPNPLDKKKPIIVIRESETAVAAYSSKCTHWGCEVPLPINGVITCPCHNSQFDATGTVLKGPAKKNLYPFSATLDGAIITIKETMAM
jgi:Rieske Fe-S protein